MRRIIFAIVLFLIIMLNTSCASMENYFTNRLHDFQDCFTFRAGISKGFGVGLRLTKFYSVCFGAGFDEQKSGWFGRNYIEYKSSWSGIPVLQVSGLKLLIVDSNEWGLLAFFAYGGGETVYDNEDFHYGWGGPFGITFGYEPCSLKDNIPFIRRAFFIECTMTLGYFGADIGFNPVEFFDFMLGIFTIDITGDDAILPRPDVPNETINLPAP